MSAYLHMHTIYTGIIFLLLFYEINKQTFCSKQNRKSILMISRMIEQFIEEGF